MADYIGSTSGIINYAGEHTDCQEFIIGTVSGVIYKLQESRPDARFYFPATRPSCQDMERITLDQVIHVLKTGENAVAMPPESIAEQAKQTLTRMLELAQ